MKNLVVATAVVAALAIAHNAKAANAAVGMGMSATVTTVCSLTTTPIAFGEVALSGTTAGTGTVKVTCTDGGAYDVGLDDGAHAVAGQRTLVAATGGSPLNYDLFTLVDHATRWGHTVGTDTVAGTGNGAEQDLTVFGLIAAGQHITSATGSLGYADTVQATVTY